MSAATEPRAVVFQRLRVEQDDLRGQLGEGSDTKLHIVYSGVSANSWLSPIGIYNNHCGRRSSHPAGFPLAEECRRTLQERARSANSVLGRRYFEVGRQSIKKDEVLAGKSIGGDVVPSVNQGMRSLKVDSGPMVQRRPRTCFTTRELCKNKTPHSAFGDRPRTSLGGVLIKTSTNIRKKTLSDVEALPNVTATKVPAFCDTERSVDYETAQKLPRSVTDLSRCGLMTADIKRQVKVLDDKTISFRSIAAMKKAYKTRVDPEHAQMLPTAPTPPSDNGSNQKAHNVDTTRNNLYDVDQEHSERLPRDAFSSRNVGSNKPRDTKRHALKPVSCADDGDIQHGADCPYNCKGCFRVCLASDDYFKKAEADRTKQDMKKHSRNVPRKIIRTIRREMPETRVFFMLATAASHRSANLEATAMKQPENDE